jgi:hypothetical protein
MKRRLPAALALLSLLLSLGLTALWVASHWHVYAYERESGAAAGRDWVQRRTAVGVTDGVFSWTSVVRVQTLPVGDPPPPAPPPPRWSRTPVREMHTWHYDHLPRTSAREHLGFFDYQTAARGPAASITTTVRYIPMWSLALASALPAAAWLAFRGRAALRARTRRRRGLCPACGYDLRAIEAERCPECGSQGTGGVTEKRG